jgi:hypothetical protein
MRKWLKRWRWWLSAGLGLAVVGSLLGALLFESLSPSSVRPIDRIQLGMTANEVDAVMDEIREMGRSGRDILILEEESEKPASLMNDSDAPHDYALKPYTFESGQITVGFVDDRAFYKSSISSNPSRTLWAKFRLLLRIPP